VISVGLNVEQENKAAKSITDFMSTLNSMIADPETPLNRKEDFRKVKNTMMEQVLSYFS